MLTKTVVSLLRNIPKNKLRFSNKSKDWSSKKEHKENALALGADERRDKLR